MLYVKKKKYGHVSIMTCNIVIYRNLAFSWIFSLKKVVFYTTATLTIRILFNYQSVFFSLKIFEKSKQIIKVRMFSISGLFTIRFLVL